MFKKIVSLSALSLSALLLILSVVDVFADSVFLFEALPLKLAVVLLILLTVTVTVTACFMRAWRRPLLLLACLLHTPLAGGTAVVWLYGICFPEAMPMKALFPFLVALISFASVIQTTVMVVGEGMYDADPEEPEEDDSLWEDDDEDMKIVPNAAPKKSLVGAAAGQNAVTDEELEDGLDDLSPEPKKRRKAAERSAAANNVSRPQAAKPEASAQNKFTDPFALLSEAEDFDQWKKSVKDIFGDEKNGQ